MRYLKKLSLSMVILLTYTIGMQGMWQSPVTISSQYDDSHTARLAFNSGGTGFAVWPQATGLSVNLTPFPVFLSNYNPSTQSWTSLDTLTQLGQSNYGDADQAIALDQNGNGLVVWARGTGEFSNSNITAINYINGVFSPVNSPVVLSQAYSFAPEIAMSPDGDAIVTWVVANIDTYSCYIQAAYYKGTTHDWVRDTNGLPIIQTIQDNIQFLDPYLPFPQVAMDSNHRALFVWAQLGFDIVATVTYYTSAVWSLTYDGSDWATWTPTGSEQLSYGLNGYLPTLAMNTSGDATVVWAGTLETDYPEEAPFAIEAARYDGATQDYIRTPSGAIFIQDLEINVYPLSIPRAQVAIDPLGNSIIVWDNSYNIDVAQYSYTTSWTSWMPTITTLINNYVLLPTVAMDPSGNGNAMAMWMIYVEPYGNLLLEASAYNPINGWDISPTLIVNDTNHDIDFYVTENDWPNLTYDHSGNVYAAWAQSDGRVARAYIAQYNPNLYRRTKVSCPKKKNNSMTATKTAQIQARIAFLHEKNGIHRIRPKVHPEQTQKKDAQCTDMSKGIR